MSDKKVRWGILGTAKIAVKHVIPAIEKSHNGVLTAVASRSLNKAHEVASQFGIPKAYDRYEAILEDPEIDAVYIPLPNHLHVKWSQQCMEAGKHVLCEKPLALSVDSLKGLIEARNRTGMKICEAFMVKTHPQWIEAKKIVDSGQLGDLKSIHGFFSYKLTDDSNVRNQKDYGGGGLYDIGCYPITLSRYIYQEEPTRVFAHIVENPQSGVDVMASAIMEFPKGSATFTCGMNMERWQTMQFFGSNKTLEVHVPFNAPNDRPNKLYINQGDILDKYKEAILLPALDQYAVHVAHFADAVLFNKEVAVPLEDTYLNTQIIEALFRSGKTGKWESL